MNVDLPPKMVPEGQVGKSYPGPTSPVEEVLRLVWLPDLPDIVLSSGSTPTTPSLSSVRSSDTEEETVVSEESI